MSEKINSMEINITPQQFQEWRDEKINLYQLPCTPAERHFLVTGMSIGEVEKLELEVAAEILAEDT